MRFEFGTESPLHIKTRYGSVLYSNNIWRVWYGQGLSEANSHSKNCAMGGMGILDSQQRLFWFSAVVWKACLRFFFRVGLWSHFASSLKMNSCGQSWPFWSALLVIYIFVFLLRLYYNKPRLSLYSGGNGCTRTATTPFALLKATSSAGDTPPLKGYYLQWPQAALPGSSSGGNTRALSALHPS